MTRMTRGAPRHVDEESLAAIRRAILGRDIRSGVELVRGLIAIIDDLEQKLSGQVDPNACQECGGTGVRPTGGRVVCNWCGEDVVNRCECGRTFRVQG